MLLNKTDSYIFESYIAQSNIDKYAWPISKHISCRLSHSSTGSFFYILHLPCFSDGTWECFVSLQQSSDRTFWIPTWLKNSLPSFEYIRKIVMATFLRKAIKGQNYRDILLCYYDTTPAHSEEQHQPFKQIETASILLFGYQSCTWPRPGPFCWQDPCSSCYCVIKFVVPLEYTFVQLYSNAEQIF